MKHIKNILLLLLISLMLSCASLDIQQKTSNTEVASQLSLKMMLSLYNKDDNTIINNCKSVIYYEEDSLGKYIPADSLVYYIAQNIDISKSIQNRDFKVGENTVEFLLGYNNVQSFDSCLNIKFKLNSVNLIEQVYVSNL